MSRTCVEKARAKVAAGILMAPKSFVDAPLELLEDTCNGCGAESAFIDYVPDKIWGLCICGPCAVHDFEYSVGETEEDKFNADLRFLGNILRLIKHQGGSGIKRLVRKRRAYKYYDAVDTFGDSAFYGD